MEEYINFLNLYIHQYKRNGDYFQQFFKNSLTPKTKNTSKPTYRKHLHLLKVVFYIQVFTHGLLKTY